MTNILDTREFQGKLQRLDELLCDTDQADPAARARLLEIVRSLLDLHAAGLDRLLERIADAGAPGRTILDECARDGVVSGMLLLHDLHPLGTEDRIERALENVRPYLRSHGGNVELMEWSDGVVRLRLEGSCHHCPSSAVTMQQMVEEAIYGLAPEVEAIEVETSVDEHAHKDGDRLELLVI